MNKIEEIKSLACELDNLVIVKNNEVIYATSEVKISNNTIVLDNEELKVFYLIDKNIDLNYQLNNESSLTEVYYDIANGVEINQHYNILDNSHINLIEVQNNGFNRNVHINLLDNAYLKLDNLFINSDSSKYNSYVDIQKSNSTCQINNVIISLCGCSSTFNFDVCHNMPSSTSNMVTYAVSKNSSVLYVNTNGIIKKSAAKTELNQKTKGLILDATSQIAANPILEIDEFDVIASHGASIGAIDDEELYYLMSRGLPKEQSEKLIISGLIYPFLNAISSDSIKSYVSKVINSAL